MSTKSPALSMKDREELLEMVTNCKLIAVKLRAFHNKHIFHPKAPECANQAVLMDRVSQILSMIEKAHGEPHE